MSRPWVRGLMWILVAAVMVMIFCFSAQDGEASTGTSDKVVKPIVATVARRNPSMTSAMLEELYLLLQAIVRKGAHFMEFTLLGITLRLLGESYGWRRRGWIAWGVGTLYAMTDEAHQLTSFGRMASGMDIAIDSLGVLAGVMLSALVLSRIYKRKARQKL